MVETQTRIFRLRTEEQNVLNDILSETQGSDCSPQKRIQRVYPLAWNSTLKNTGLRRAWEGLRFEKLATRTNTFHLERSSHRKTQLPQETRGYTPAPSARQTESGHARAAPCRQDRGTGDLYPPISLWARQFGPWTGKGEGSGYLDCCSPRTRHLASVWSLGGPAPHGFLARGALRCRLRRKEQGARVGARGSMGCGRGFI